MNRFCEIFPTVTGLKLDVTEMPADDQLTFPWKGAVQSYNVSLESTSRSKLGSHSELRDFESALGGLLNLISDTQRQLRQRDAELAAAVPVVSVEADGEHLAERLEAVLRGASEILHCFGAGLYMLDEATTSLKLRSSYGLKSQALMQPPRRLEEAAADVEALAGHAIVIEDIEMQTHWTIPEPSKAAMCIPVSTATTILGTLWMYRDHAGNFTPQDQNIAEITAGRLAADLERSVLTQEVRTLRSRLPKDVDFVSPTNKPRKSAVALTQNENAIAEWCEGRLNRLAPFVEGWDLADGYTNIRANGGFCNWHCCNADRMHVAIGQANNSTNPQLSSVAFQAAHAAHTQHDPSLDEVFAMSNQSLWTSSIEGEEASLLHAILDPTCGRLEYAISGGVFGYILRPHAWEPLLPGAAKLGVDCECKIERHHQMLMPGDIFVAISNPHSRRSPDGTSGMNRVAEQLLRNTHLNSNALSELAVKELKSAVDGNLAILVAKRCE